MDWEPVSLLGILIGQIKQASAVTRESVLKDVPAWLALIGMLLGAMISGFGTYLAVDRRLGSIEAQVGTDTKILYKAAADVEALKLAHTALEGTVVDTKAELKKTEDLTDRIRDRVSANEALENVRHRR